MKVVQMYENESKTKHVQWPPVSTCPKEWKYILIIQNLYYIINKMMAARGSSNYWSIIFWGIGYLDSI